MAATTLSPKEQRSSPRRQTHNHDHRARPRPHPQRQSLPNCRCSKPRKVFWHPDYLEGRSGGCENIETCLFRTTMNLMQANAVIVYLQRQWAQREEEYSGAEQWGKLGYGNVGGHNHGGVVIAYKWEQGMTFLRREPEKVDGKGGTRLKFEG